MLTFCQMQSFQIFSYSFKLYENQLYQLIKLVVYTTDEGG